MATVLIECLLVHILFYSWFGLKARKPLKIALFMAAYFLLQSFITLLPLYPVFRTTISCFLVLAVVIALYDTTKSAAVCSAFLFIALAVVSEYLSLALLNTLDFDVNALMTEGNARAIYLALAKTVNFAIVLVAASVLRKNRAALTPRQVVPLLLCLVVSIYLCTVFFRVFPNDKNDLSLTLVLALAGILYMNGMIVLNTQWIKNTVVEIEEQKLAVRQYEMQEQYYRNVVSDREETRSLWHDVKKHMTAMEALIQSGDSQTAATEYAAIHPAFDTLGNIVDVENEVLNTILHHHIQRAKEHGVSVSLTVRVSPKISIAAVDLSVILGNTFDNAMDECLMLEGEQREISVTLVQRNHMLFYEIKNPCREIPHKKSGKHYGYGLKNVETCVQKYGGAMEKSKGHGHYCVSIRLNCQER
jgi:sensor histidine kinase YesM